MGTEAKSLVHEEIIFRSKFPAVEVPEDVTLPEFVLSGIEPYLDKVAVVDSITGKGYTYREVKRDVYRFSKALRSLGLRKGRVVVVLLPNVAEYATLALGIMAAGGVFSGANPNGHASEIKSQVEAADAKLIVTDGSTYHKVKDLGVPVIIQGEDRIEGTINCEELLEAADKANTNTLFIDDKVLQTDLCALPFSSGTTGVSKGVMLSHENLVANLCSTLFGVGPELIGQVATLGLIPFFHIYGLTGICCATIKNKGMVVVMQRYELRLFLSALIRHRVTFAPIVPPIMLGLVKNPIVDEFDLTKLCLRSVLTAAAPLAPEILNAFQRKFPGVDVQEAYGMTEHSCITLSYGGVVAKRNSVGFILPNLEVKFVDPDTGRSLPKNAPGEICVRSKCVMKGYYKKEQETAITIDKDGWLHTGDIGYIDDDGDVFLVDRIKELIKYKGFQVAPAELEAILLSHPSVEDAAVVGLPDEEAGEIPAACVVIKAGAKESEEDIIKYVSSKSASYKRVRLLQFVSAIPKSPSGKILRRLIRENMLKDLHN
ncbi:4-coumarate--CoA ligase-like 1 [Salvia miltiorrhiza]|uniref:4-coumarate--CoA ligase-like 1 n=1 Tax=Salvia miltiorrhiza TaxID=226208 RepID=UPI0025ABAB58|nr:4-coumarate--CoA ligase-like 1 [Salvia miltiorrhiza]